MSLELDMFDIERYNSINEEKLGHVKMQEQTNFIKEEYPSTKSEFNHNLYRKLETHEKKDYRGRLEILENNMRKAEEGSGVAALNHMMDPMKKPG